MTSLVAHERQRIPLCMPQYKALEVFTLLKIVLESQALSDVPGLLASSCMKMGSKSLRQISAPPSVIMVAAGGIVGLEARPVVRMPGNLVLEGARQFSGAACLGTIGPLRWLEVVVSAVNGLPPTPFHCPLEVLVEDPCTGKNVHESLGLIFLELLKNHLNTSLNYPYKTASFSLSICLSPQY